ncbi:MAG: M20 family metallopeptidase [Dialister sp.]|nr:M20 family metallopeptidase [Dialister sp.]
MDIHTLVDREKAHIIEWRRHFHKYPELSQQEFKTMDYIEERLHEWQIRTVRVPHGGVLGFLDGKGDGWTILMRADMDALPIQEDPVNEMKEKACVSVNEGVMHACGHDGHVAMLLAEAKILSEQRDAFDGHIVFMFEEAEEMGERGVGPLLRYIRDHHIHVDTCFGTHVKNDLPAGKIGIVQGTCLAGAYFFQATIKGKGGHGSRPDLAKSPIECFISIAEELRNFRMRMVSPDVQFTWSLGHVEAGSTPNVIPDTLTFAGTCRCEKTDDGIAFKDLFLDVLHHAATLYGCQVTVETNQYFPPTVNTKECVHLARRVIKERVGADVLDEACPMWMATETFSITEATWPGVFFFTGVQDARVGSGAGHHTPKFDIAEEGLVTGVKAALAYVLAVLEEKPDIQAFTKTDLESMLKLTE